MRYYQQVCQEQKKKIAFCDNIFALSSFAAALSRNNFKKTVFFSKKKSFFALKKPFFKIIFAEGSNIS